MNTVIEQWDLAGPAFMEDQERSEFAERNKKIVMDRFPDLTGKDVLDLGCGYGWYSGYFSSVGARVSACDGSQTMVQLAAKNHPDLSFRQADILAPLPYAADSFDLVFCNQVLMDIPDISVPVAEAARVLKPGGILYFSVVHPAFYDKEWLPDQAGNLTSAKITRYLSRYSFDNSFWGSTAHYHRPVCDYLNAAADAGLIFRQMQEPPGYDGINKSAEFPLYMFAEFIKPQPALPTESQPIG